MEWAKVDRLVIAQVLACNICLEWTSNRQTKIASNETVQRVFNQLFKLVTMHLPLIIFFHSVLFNVKNDFQYWRSNRLINQYKLIGNGKSLCNFMRKKNERKYLMPYINNFSNKSIFSSSKNCTFYSIFWYLNLMFF